jgi:hypothetical protein
MIDLKNAIVNSGSRRLICKVPANAKPGETHNLIQCYELRSDMMPVPVAPGQIGLSFRTIVVPIDIEEDPVNILGIIHNIRFLDDLPDKGQKYMNMISDYEHIMMQNKAGRAGITMASSLPKTPNKILM